MTQKTNQFNLTTIRRTEAEVRNLAGNGCECFCVEVADKFGDYGLTGVIIVNTMDDALAIETFLLSCRVLGRGVEHAMLAHVGKLALDRGLAFVRLAFVPTVKNEPALNFVRAVGVGHESLNEPAGGMIVRIPAAAAASTVYRPGDAAALNDAAYEGDTKKSLHSPVTPLRAKSERYARIAFHLATPEAVVRAVENRSPSRRTLSDEVIAADTAIQRELLDIWQRILRIDRIGIRDDFTALGGTSLKAAELFAAIKDQFGIQLPMTTILDCPTVETLAARISRAGRAESRQTLRKLKAGAVNGPTLFLVHDGDGETLLYMNLARRMPDEVTVYGIEPLGDDRCPIIHTTIPEMASYYVERLREVCPEGPYLLGGLCAGGTLSFEMALQLEGAGQKVGFVALMDAADTRAKMRPFLKLRRRWANLPGGVLPAGIEQVTTALPTDRPHWLLRMAKRGNAAVRNLHRLLNYAIENRREWATDTAKIKSMRSIQQGGVLPVGFTGPSTSRVYQYAARYYKPAHLLTAPVFLFRAGAGGAWPFWQEPLIFRLQDPLFGWGKRVIGGPQAIRKIDVPGGHGDILQEPHVVAISENLRMAIARIVVQHGSGL